MDQIFFFPHIFDVLDLIFKIANISLCVVWWRRKGQILLWRCGDKRPHSIAFNNKGERLANLAKVEKDGDYSPVNKAFLHFKEGLKRQLTWFMLFFWFEYVCIYAFFFFYCQGRLGFSAIQKWSLEQSRVIKMNNLEKYICSFSKI